MLLISLAQPHRASGNVDCYPKMDKIKKRFMKSAPGRNAGMCSLIFFKGNN